MPDEKEKKDAGRAGSSGDGRGTNPIGTGTRTLTVVDGDTPYASRTVATAAGDGKSAGDKPRPAGGVRSSAGSGSSGDAGGNPASPRAIGQLDNDDAGTGEAGIRGRADGDTGGRGGTQGGRKRGRPSKQPSIDTPEIIDRVEKPDSVSFLFTEGATKGKKSDLNPALVAFGVQQAGATAAAMTQHDWWEIEELEAKQVALPLARILNRMDPLQRKIFERYFDPIMLLFAVGMVVAPRLKAEMYLREEQAKQSSQAARWRPDVNPHGASQEGPKNGNVGAAPIFKRRDVASNWGAGID